MLLPPFIRAKLLLLPLLMPLSIQVAQPAATAAAVVTYAPDDSDFANPERGFYHQVDCSSGPIAAELLARYQAAHDSLIMCSFLLTDAIDAPIPKAKLALLQQQFDLVRMAGMKMVLRFAYNDSDNGQDAEPPRTLQHLDQLRDLLNDNRDVLAVLQAGFVGSWGEWANSQHYGGAVPSPQNWRDRKALIDRMLEILPPERMVQVRTPEIKYRLIGSEPVRQENAHSDKPSARVGHHNDCFLSSSNDWGTYRLSSPANQAWLAADSKYVAVGGETCHPNPPRSSCQSAVAELKRFHWSYINGDFHNEVLNSWRTDGCHLLIRRQLGYRFVLKHGIYQSDSNPGGKLHVLLTLANEGFAAPYNPHPVELVLRSANNVYRIPLEVDADQWQPQKILTLRKTLTLPDSIPPGDYQLLLNMPDPDLSKRPEYSIRLANSGVWDAKSGYNSLNYTIHLRSP